MPDPVETNGAAPPVEERKSLRQIAEEAYDEVVSASEQEPEGEQSGQSERKRDNFGRFVANDEAGEQSQDPAPQKDQAPSEAEPRHPAPDEGRSSEAPQHWSAEDRLTFSKLPQEGQAFLLRRHTEMERDYQSKAQATAQAASFVQAIAPVFSDPVISGSLQQAGLSPSQAVQEWAAMHRRAMSPNPNDRVGLLQDLAQRMGIDPAAAAPSRQGPAPQLSQADMQDPAIRYFADHLGRTVQDMQALRGQLSSMQQQDAERQNAEALKVTRWSIDSFAEEMDSQGKPLHPDFDLVLPQIIELFRANPDRDLKEAYETARWMRADTRDRLLQQQRHSVEQKQSDQRARQAVRGNVRGLTSPVSKPADPSGSRSLRDVIEQSAEEVGF